MNSINNINSVSDNVQFKGFGILSKAAIIERKHSAEIISAILQQDRKDIINLKKNASDRRVRFFRNLSDRYNKDNYYRKADIKEDSQLVNKIYKMIKSPENAHNDLTTNFTGTLAELYRIFAVAGNKSKRVNFANRINREVLSYHNNVYRGMIPELLESSNIKEYMKNYSKYKSYLKLNRDNKDVVKNLDEMVTNGTYDRKKYDILYINKNLHKEFLLPDTEIFNADNFVENYSKAGRQFLEYIATHFYIDKPLLQMGADTTLFDIFKTCNEKNINMRIAILKILGRIRVPHKDNDLQVKQFNELKKLYDTLDNDKYARKFMQDFVDNSVYDIISINSMNEILKLIPAQKLAIFSHNAKNIIKQTHGRERIETLKNELENPFFETEMTKERKKDAIKYGYQKRESVLRKLVRKIINDIKILEYRKVENRGVSAVKSASAAFEPEIEIIKTEPEIIMQPAETVKKVQKAESKDINVIEAPDKKMREVYESEISAVEKQPMLAAKKKANKEEIKKNIFEIISSKLGPKTYAKQQDAFGAYATKIRLGMLPEIFSSIADTRKTDRAAGKYRINSSNKDVLDLYLLVNGNNKKYVNYLLKKRNVDNTRMFEVKDIISMIRKAEAKIQQEKKTNPQYRARDARKYYNHLYESKIQQYGKVKRQVNKKA